MKKLISLFILSCLIISITMAQEKIAYKIYDAQGKSLKYKKVMKAFEPADIICFGELHNNPIAHWLQFEVLNDLIATKGAANMAVGAEMFETHQQVGLDSLLGGELEAKDFRENFKMWNNYATDYQPIVTLCKDLGIPVIATNVPRKYARMVAMAGGPAALDTLPDNEKALLAPLPYEIDYELPSYAAMREMVSGHGSKMNAEHFIAAQAIKDATMAHFILENWQTGKTFYHLNGSYHSDSKEGIIWYLLQANPDLNIVNLTVVEQESVGSLNKEHKGKADIIIVVPFTMTKTY